MAKKKMKKKTKTVVKANYLKIAKQPRTTPMRCPCCGAALILSELPTTSGTLGIPMEWTVWYGDGPKIPKPSRKAKR